MELKVSVKKKINDMSREELLELLNNLCAVNDDVIKYLNNCIANTKINKEKYIARIGKCFNSYNINCREALDIYLNVKKITTDYAALSEIGLSLLDNLLWFLDFGYSNNLVKKIDEISSMVCGDIARAVDNISLRITYENYLSRDLYDEIVEIILNNYYCYFDEKIKE